MAGSAWRVRILPYLFNLNAYQCCLMQRNLINIGYMNECFSDSILTVVPKLFSLQLIYFAFNSLWYGTASYSTCKSFAEAQKINQPRRYVTFSSHEKLFLCSFFLRKRVTLWGTPAAHSEKLSKWIIPDSWPSLLLNASSPEVVTELSTGWRNELNQNDHGINQDSLMKSTSMSPARVDRRKITQCKHGHPQLCGL